jgi:DNA-binding NtrC family response regulator
MNTPRPRILFVDDSPSVLLGLRRVLADMEDAWELHFAAGAQDALARMADGPFDLLATDLKMPGMEGDALIHLVRDRWPATCCLLLCGDAGDPQAVAIAAQGHAVIEKPCDRNAIRSTIETTYSQHNRTGEPKETAKMNDDIPHGVLVVDDDPRYRESMLRLLWTLNESFPVRTLEAADGEQAMAQLRNERVDCMLLDHRMPGGTGVEWIARFLAADPFLAIVMVTGQGDETTAVRAMQQGAMDYLVKGSISAEAIQRAVTNAIEKMAMRRTMDKQREVLLVAERHRVMIESLGAACHHLGQPMSTVTMCLEILRRQPAGPTVQALVEKCEEAVEAVNDILERLQRVSIYRTEPYLATARADSTRKEERILSIDETPDPHHEKQPGKG